MKRFLLSCLASLVFHIQLHLYNEGFIIIGITISYCLNLCLKCSMMFWAFELEINFCFSSSIKVRVIRHKPFVSLYIYQMPWYLRVYRLIPSTTVSISLKNTRAPLQISKPGLERCLLKWLLVQLSRDSIWRLATNRKFNQSVITY